MNEQVPKDEKNNVVEITPQKTIFVILKRMITHTENPMSEKQVDSYQKYINQEIERIIFNNRKNKTKDEVFNEVKIEDYDLPNLELRNKIHLHLASAYLEYEEQKVRFDENTKLY